MSYLDQLKKSTNEALTENNATSNRSTLDPVLDFFARAGAMRDDRAGAVKLFSRAYAADPELALKALFYLRDVRGGQGERDLFRAILAQTPPPQNLIKYIPYYGRWDDLFVLGKDGQAEVTRLIAAQLEDDEAAMAEGQSVSLLAKWLPSENASSKESTRRAASLAKQLGLSPAKYRKKVVALRKHIKLLEQQMSARQWNEIDFEKIPSQAHRKHVKAFRRHEDETGYASYLEAVDKGEKKIKTSTLYTYEVFDLVGSDEAAANTMWANLPDYTSGSNALVLADVSGSMAGRPMSISVSLALYFAERNQGPFNGYFMTFTGRPQLVEVQGKTLAQKLRNIESADWEQNTNLEAAFQAILTAAQANHATADEMPKILYVISDMEFDACIRTNHTNFENSKTMFEEAGFKLPHVVFWCVSSRNDQVPATMYDDGVTLVSGSSQSTFRYAVEGKSPLELMAEVLGSERYAPIAL